MQFQKYYIIELIEVYQLNKIHVRYKIHYEFKDKTYFLAD